MTDIRSVGWRHRTYTKKAYPPTQTPHIRQVGWLLNALLIPMLLNASPPYTACSPYFYNPKRHPHPILSQSISNHYLPLISSVLADVHTVRSL